MAKASARLKVETQELLKELRALNEQLVSIEHSIENAKKGTDKYTESHNLHERSLRRSGHALLALSFFYNSL